MTPGLKAAGEGPEGAGDLGRKSLPAEAGQCRGMGRALWAGANIWGGRKCGVFLG